MAHKSPVPTTFDSVFRSVDPGTIPIPYMRALASSESTLNPAAKTGRHFGLFQISPDVVADVNKKTGSTFTHDDMFDPRNNAFVFARYYHRFIKPILRRDGGVRENWGSADYPRLVTAAWNSGVGAVGRGLKEAKRLGVVQSRLHEGVCRHGPDRRLLTDKKCRYHRRVAALFQKEKRIGGSGAATGGGEAFLLLILILALSRS